VAVRCLNCSAEVEFYRLEPLVCRISYHRVPAASAVRKNALRPSV
jgi:hypothetical protein